jgi:hypothetical protein
MSQIGHMRHSLHANSRGSSAQSIEDQACAQDNSQHKGELSHFMELTPENPHQSVYDLQISTPKSRPRRDSLRV